MNSAKDAQCYKCGLAPARPAEAARVSSKAEPCNTPLSLFDAGKAAAEEWMDEMERADEILASAKQPRTAPSAGLRQTGNLKAKADELLASAEQSLLMNSMMRPGFANPDQAPPPTFHEDYEAEHGWPTDNPVHAELCRAILTDEYVAACGQPWFLETLIRKGTFPFSDQDWLKRFNGIRAMDIYCDLQESRGSVRPGEVLDVWQGLPPSTCTYTHPGFNFCNQPPGKLALRRGTTHVAVGFCDLSELLSCDLTGDEGGRAGPLQWVGVEVSNFCVAKTQVLVEMLRRDDVPLSHCLQMWLSSTTSRAAAESFKACATKIK